MPFESLSYRFNFTLNNFPERWLPLIHLYDPDLPLFPIYYFHATSRNLPGARPGLSDRIFGYVQKINSLGGGVVDVHIITNKDLTLDLNLQYKILAEIEIKERIGLNNPVQRSDVSNAFIPPLNYANPVLDELWQRVISNTYDNILPFGRLWDEVLGLTRFVASWYSTGGRKGELIQTHYFSSKFGQEIQSSAGIQQVDFYLLPTIDELLDNTNPLNIFPKYSSLVEVADRFRNNTSASINVNGVSISKFTNPKSGSLDTEGILNLLSSNFIPNNLRHYGIECFNTFGKGPQRTVIFLLMLSDLRNNRIDYKLLDSSTLGSIYDGLAKTYQSPKVIHIYAQQSFGNAGAMPIDTWIETFFKWPLNLFKSLPARKAVRYTFLFSHANNLGKVERLLWIAAQSRKVHSSACNDAIWCTKLASIREPRGANPLACRICLTSIRNVCPAYQDIKTTNIVFNGPPVPGNFLISTSANNNATPNQKFTKCVGKSIYEEIVDDFSPSDNPNGFSPYPAANHSGSVITVDQFINTY